MKTEILFTPDSTNLPSLILEVDYDFQPACKPSPPSYASGGEPGHPPFVEVNAVWCKGFDENPPWGHLVFGSRVSEVIGELCRLLDPKQIERRTLEAHGEREEGLRDDAAEAKFQKMRDGD